MIVTDYLNTLKQFSCFKIFLLNCWWKIKQLTCLHYIDHLNAGLVYLRYWWSTTYRTLPIFIYQNPPFFLFHPLECCFLLLKICFSCLLLPLCSCASCLCSSRVVTTMSAWATAMEACPAPAPRPAQTLTIKWRRSEVRGRLHSPTAYKDLTRMTDLRVLSTDCRSYISVIWSSPCYPGTEDWETGKGGHAR